MSHRQGWTRPDTNVVLSLLPLGRALEATCFDYSALESSSRIATVYIGLARSTSGLGLIEAQTRSTRSDHTKSDP